MTMPLLINFVTFIALSVFVRNNINYISDTTLFNLVALILNAK